MKNLLASTCLALVLLVGSSSGLAQAVVCDYRESELQTPVDPEEAARRQHYREQLAVYQALLPNEPETRLLIPVAGVRVAQVANTWGAARDGGRSHEGQDIFAPRGTPVYAATPGYVYRIDTRERGGRVVWIAGAGGRRYYYAHLEDWADIEEGMVVSADTVLGFVGNSGNAITTPPHLHFGIYSGSRRTCDRQVYDPLPLLVDR